MSYKTISRGLTFDLVTPKSIGVCIESCTTCIPSLKVVGEKLLKLSQHIEVWTDVLQCHTKPLAVTLTFDLVTPKSIGVCVTLRTTRIPSLKVEGKQSLKLLQLIEGVPCHTKPLAVTLTFDLVTPKTIGVCVM